MLASCVLILHGNARSHNSCLYSSTAGVVQLAVVWPPSMQPNLAPPDYYLFSYLKNWLGSECINNNKEFMEGVKTWLSSQVADVFDSGIQSLFLDRISASITAMTTVRSSLNVYVFLCIQWLFPHCLFFSSSSEVTFQVTLILHYMILD
jgi:hypothetical protein